MAFESEIHKSYDRKKLQLQDVKTSSKFILANARNVLDVSLTISMVNQDVRENVLNYTAKLDYNVVFINEEGKVASSVFSSDTSGRTELINISGIELFENSTIFKFNGGELEINSILAVRGIVISTEDNQVVKSGNENCYEQAKTIKINELIKEVKATFIVTDESEVIKDIGGILKSTAGAIIKNADVSGDFVTVYGEIFTELVYLQDTKVEKIVKTIPFTEEIAFNVEIPAESVARAVVRHVLVENTASYEADEDKTTVYSKYNVTVEVVAIKEEEVAIITDIFSKTNKLISSTECFNNCTIVGTFNRPERLALGIVLPEKKGIDQIVSINGSKAYLTNQKTENGVVTLEGFISCSVMFKSYNSEELKVINVKGAFNVFFNIDTDKAASIVDASINVKFAGNKMKSATELELLYDLDINLAVYKEEIVTFISKITEDEPKTSTDAGISVFVFDQNKTSFEIGKAFNISPEEVEKQRQAGSKLVVYSGLNKR